MSTQLPPPPPPAPPLGRFVVAAYDFDHNIHRLSEAQWLYGQKQITIRLESDGPIATDQLSRYMYGEHGEYPRVGLVLL